MFWQHLSNLGASAEAAADSAFAMAVSFLADTADHLGPALSVGLMIMMVLMLGIVREALILARRR